jgi:acetyl esterase
MKSSLAWLSVGFAWVASLQAASNSFYEKGGGFAPDARVLYKKAFGKKEKKTEELHLEFFYPDGFSKTDSRPSIVFFFGGGWTGGSTSQFYPQAEYLASRGMVAICAQYRRSLKTAKPVWCVEDARSSVRYLRKRASALGLDPKRIAAGGGSAGGHLAAATATISAFDCKDDDLSVSAVPNALVLFNPVFDNSPKGFGHDRLRKDYKKFSPIDNLDGKQPPTIVFLGDRDQHLPVASAKRYEKTMKAKGNVCKTFIYEGKGHGFFNLHKNGRNSFVATVTETDQFLAGLGFLQGKPRVEAWLQAEEKK